MIVRFLAMIGVIYLVIRATRLWLSAVQPKQPIERADEELSRIDDVMVKDPYCNVYFPKRDGVQVKHKGQDLYFCSDTCREKFMAEHQ
jgi:YHS domain-containing protein